MVCLSVIELWIKLISEKNHLILHTTSRKESIMPGPASSAISRKICACGKHISPRHEQCKNCLTLLNSDIRKIAEGDSDSAEIANLFIDRAHNGKVFLNTYIRFGNKYYSVKEFLEGVPPPTRESAEEKAKALLEPGKSVKVSEQHAILLTTDDKIMTKYEDEEFVEPTLIQLYNTLASLENTLALEPTPVSKPVKFDLKKEEFPTLAPSDADDEAKIEEVLVEIEESRFLHELSLAMVPKIGTRPGKCHRCGRPGTVSLPNLGSVVFETNTCANCARGDLFSMMTALDMHIYARS